MRREKIDFVPMDRYRTFNSKILLLILAWMVFSPELTYGVFAQDTLSAQDTKENQPATTNALDSSDDNPTAPKEQKKPSSKSSKELSPPFLQLPSGERVLINDQQKLEDLIDVLDKNSKSKIPSYSFNSIQMEGTVLDDHVDLNVTISLSINKTDSPVEIPFYLNQGFLTKAPEYQGDGQLLQSGQFQKDGHGYSWWLEGKGKHTLKFPIRLKLSRQLNENRLQLTLPPSSISQLSLNIPEKSIQVQNITNGFLEQVKQDNSTVLKVSLTGTDLDLRWHSVPENLKEDNYIQSRIHINLHVRDDSYLINAIQTIEIRNGSVQEVGIQLPAHFELVDVNSPLYLSHKIDKNRHVRLKFSKPLTDSVDISWNLEAARSTYDDSLDETPESDVILNGFQLDKARKQTGTIGIYAPRGFHISRDKDQSRNTHRINPYKINLSQDVLSAYAFERQPFLLKLSTIELPPNYSVEPYLGLKFTDKHVELEALFRFEIPSKQSALKSIQFHWPDFNKEDWTVEPINVPGLIETVHPTTILPDGSFIITVREDESNRSHLLEIPIKARIKLSNNQKQITLGLPTAEANIQKDPVIIIEEDPNMIVNFSQSGNKNLVELKMNFNRDQLPIPFKKHNQARFFHTKPDDLSYEVTLAKRPLLVYSSASIVAIQKQERISVNQTIDFDVKNESIDRIELTVSTKEISQKEISFLLDGNKIDAEYLKSSEGNFQRISLKLPDSKIGVFQIQIDYELPDNNIIENSHLDIPVFHPQFAGRFLSELTFEYRGMKHINPIISGKSWKKITGPDGQPLWITGQPSNSISLTLSNSPASFDYSIEKTLIRNEIQDNQCFSKAEYLLSGNADDLTITIPTELSIQSIWWNQNQLEESDYFSVNNEYGNLRIIQSSSLDSNKSKNLLTINYTQKINQTEILSPTWTILSPQFPDNIWTYETIQEIILPVKQHLLTYPEGYDPLFSWTRKWFYWKREPIKSFSNLNNWIQSRVTVADSDSGNKYAFHCSGAPHELKFQSMANSIVVLFGAGFALLTSFLLIKIPATRSVFSLFILILILAFLRIWFENSITLFIQPAILGMALAYLATMIENRFKREPAKNMVSLSSPSDLYVPAMPHPQSTLDHVQSIQAGSEDPTSVREFTSNPLSQSDSGRQL